jgi:futalosine hydrolase
MHIPANFAKGMDNKSYLGLLVMATRLEAGPLLDHFVADPSNFRLYRGKNHWDGWMLLITGIGMVNTALYTGITLSSFSFKQAVNAGVAGSFSKQLSLGTVLRVVEDGIPELGAEDHDTFMNLTALGIYFPEQLPLDADNKISVNRDDAVFPALWTQLPEAKAVSVNKVHGNAHSIETFQAGVVAELESMEGAGFMMACKAMNLPFLQIRSISNYVEPRNRDAWKMGLALHNLHKTLNNGLTSNKQ